MRAIASLLLLTACTGPGDLAPDEFELFGSRGWGNSSMGRIGQPWTLDGETDNYALGAGLTWYLNTPAPDPMEGIRAFLVEWRVEQRRQAPVTPPQEPAHEHEAENEGIDAQAVGAALGALLLAVVTYLGRAHIPVVKRWTKAGKGD